MKVSMEGYAQLLNPWDLTFTIDGVDYRTRPLTIGDMAVMEMVEKKGGDGIMSLIALVKSLFVGEPRPDVDAMPAEYLMVIVGACMNYWSEHAKKNATKIQGAMAAYKAVPPQSGN